MELTSPKVIKQIAEQFDFGFSKGLGQNFLLDPQVLDKIADAADIDDGVLEVGPGFGVLTKRLCETGKKVVSVEIDKRLIPVLDFTLAEFDNVKIIEKDILKTDVKALIDEEFDGKRISVAANLPYYITTPIITKLIEEKLPIKNIVVMVQKEVAERIAAKPGKKDYGAISVLCQYYTNPRLVTIVPKGSFYPAPKVDSAVLCMEVQDKPNVEVLDEKLFFKVVKSAFAQRRKTLLNCLSTGFSCPKEALSELLLGIGIEPTVRGEKLGLSEFAKIADALKTQGLA
ncbi:MAG: 16S rRNA (adenine(1518)-N(6)/adenine(1519)-N(6))-dimethyltransferase RsmA [Clostridia bacterium]|nr:16S rRNA (adenine(1518)-N(6)/adenine(1519)-N(6))-dimethyltransferase RsmA [Clostridia bacterium]